MTAAEAPREPDLPERLPPVELAELDHDATFDEVAIAGPSLTSQRARGVTFQTARLAHLDLSGSRLEDLTIAESVLDACNLANFHAHRARGVESLRGAALEWSDIVGMAGTWAAALGIEVLDGD
jgi:uncharacterized protein YjbI with pentapeptide repeats